MTNSLIHVVVTLILTTQFIVLVPAQQPAQPKRVPNTAQDTQTKRQAEDEVVRITTNLVQVDPVVTDKNGKQVTDLRPEEVQIFEDGKQQQITNFSYIPLENAAVAPATTRPLDKNAPPAPPTRVQPEDVRRTIALVVDDLGLSFESTYYTRRALKKFLDTQMQPTDLVALIRTAGGVGVLQQFTTDKRQLYAAVERLKWNMIGRGGVGAFAPINSTTSPPSDDDEESAAEELDRFREDVFATGTLGAVNYVVRGLRELPGRKSILLISDGLKIDPYRNQRVLTAMQNLVDAANRASVVIYTMDARGLPTLGLTAADSTSGMTVQQVQESISKRGKDLFDSQSGMIFLAEQTGGIAVLNNNDLSGGIRRVLNEQQGYYLIGYRPDESTFDPSGRRKFHKLSLKVTRPGKFNIRMRNGFFGVTEETGPTDLTRGQQLVKALTSPFGAAGVQVRLTSLFANDPKNGSVLRSMLHIDGADLTFTPEADGWHKAMFDIMAITFGDNGIPVDQLNRTHTIRVRGSVYERMLKDGFTYHINVPVKKPGAYQLRTALRDVPSERVGSASQFVEVPDIKKNRLTISGIVLRGISRETYLKAAQVQDKTADKSDDQVESTDPKANPAIRQFKSGLVMLYGYVIYNAQTKGTQPQLQAQVRLFRNGQQVFTGKELPVDLSNQSDLKRIASGGAVQLGSELPPGEYAFQLVVTDLLAKSKHRVATQWIDFEIVK